MKTIITFTAVLLLFSFGCNKDDKQNKASAKNESNVTAGISPNKDTESKNDIVKIALGSKDHTTLVTALQAADLVVSLSNAGPFTVFAPVNPAFEKLPPGTVEELLKPENKSKLAGILQHHVAVAVYSTDMLQDGMNLSMVDGKNAKITKKEGAVYIDKAKIIASIPATNGIVHVVDEVILPQ